MEEGKGEGRAGGRGEEEDKSFLALRLWKHYGNTMEHMVTHLSITITTNSYLYNCSHCYCVRFFILSLN